MNNPRSAAAPASSPTIERACPPVVVSAHQCEDEEEEPAAQRHQSEQVDPARLRVTGLPNLQERHRESGQPHGHVDEEHPSPSQAVRECPADERTDGDGHADRGAVDAHRRPTFAPGWELLGHQGERHGEHRRTADTLERPGDVEEQGIRCQSSRQGGGREHDETGGEYGTASEPVGQRAGGQDDGSERQRVGVDHPLEVVEACVQVPGYRRQCRVHHGDIEQQHERGPAHDDEGPPFPRHLASPCVILVRERYKVP